MGEPSACQHQGRISQLAQAMGVEPENGFTLGYDKYNWDVQPHFITEDATEPIDFGEYNENVYAMPGTAVLAQQNKAVQLSANEFGKGRCVYIGGLPYSFSNARLLHRALLWAAGKELALHRWFSENSGTELHAYVDSGRYCVVNNTNQQQKTVVWLGDGEAHTVHLEAGSILWKRI